MLEGGKYVKGNIIFVPLYKNPKVNVHKSQYYLHLLAIKRIIKAHELDTKNTSYNGLKLNIFYFLVYNLYVLKQVSTLKIQNY